jgi:hypothetical protein
MLRPSLRSLARSAHRALGGTGEIWLYGELFGGHYPHPAVTPVAGLVPVQTGIWYAPDLQFAVFDIVQAVDAAEPSFLDHDRVQEIASGAGFRTAPVLARGRFADLDCLPVRFSTRVPELLGLPAISANDAEGYVLKPAAGAPARSKVGTDLNRVAEEAALDAMIDLRDMFPRRVEAMSPDQERALLAFLDEKTRTLA